MKLYKITFAEFERFENEEEFVSYSFGTTNRIFKTREECVQYMKEEYDHIARVYGIAEVLEYKQNEFKVRCFAKNNRKETVHHYKIIKFSS